MDDFPFSLQRKGGWLIRRFDADGPFVYKPTADYWAKTMAMPNSATLSAMVHRRAYQLPEHLELRDAADLHPLYGWVSI